MNCEFEIRYLSGDCEMTLTSQDGKNGDLTVSVLDTGKRRTVTVTALRPVRLLSYTEKKHDFPFLDETKDGKDDLYFMNGYQSWTDTGEFYLTEKERDVKKLPKKIVDLYSFDRYGDASFYKYDPGKLHGYDYFYSKGRKNAFVASLNCANAYLLTEVSRRTGEFVLIGDISGASLEEGGSYTVCDYLYAGSYEEGIRVFDEFFPRKPVKKMLGYTSWYNYGQNINEDIISRDLDALDGRFELFQIDDGYESAVGDWLEIDLEKFPRGLSVVVEEIHKKGMLAGIWLAPFVAEEKSRIFSEKPHWFKKGQDGKAVKCGSNWSGFYALDMENPEVRTYISDCLKHYVDMGFDFFKLDFLYASHLPVYEGRTRSRVAEESYAFLREALGNKLILGCGGAISNSAGKFDYMRVGPDVSLKFDDVWFMRFMHRERISTKTTLKNTVYRSFTDGRLFGNDPDVFLLRDGNADLSAGQKYALISINALFGSLMMTSDNISEYDDEKRALIQNAFRLFREGTTESYSRVGDHIEIKYSLNGKTNSFLYNTRKGIIE